MGNPPVNGLYWGDYESLFVACQYELGISSVEVEKG
jgi:hypothetical protein